MVVLDTTIHVFIEATRPSLRATAQPERGNLPASKWIATRIRARDDVSGSSETL
jgi:hypothetical protein